MTRAERLRFEWLRALLPRPVISPAHFAIHHSTWLVVGENGWPPSQKVLGAARRVARNAFHSSLPQTVMIIVAIQVPNTLPAAHRLLSRTTSHLVGMHIFLLIGLRRR